MLFSTFRNYIANNKCVRICAFIILILHRITNHLGAGEFGSVSRAYWKQHKPGQREVAVKSVPPNASKTDRVKLLEEAAMMGQFHHPNVVQLHGIITIGMPVCDHP